MEFFQAVDPVTLVPASYAQVALELLFAVVFTVLLGVCLQVLPEKLVCCSKTGRSKVPRDAVAKASAPASKSSTTNKPSSSASPALSFSAGAPPARAPKTLAKAVVPAPSAALAESTLDDVLDAFFEGETLLDEALVDATVLSAPAEEETPGTHSISAKSTPPPLKNMSDFSRGLAVKRTKGPQRQASGGTTASLVHAASKPCATKDKSERELEDALDAYMEGERLLDEAMLDSAVEAAHRT
ncbi:unspecified product [Leishmania tarentolae]|uniref:Unspecified product n=1 Tax=Leishmania tarentolae TaxID=5689 RepID=A0A640KDD3_LEITA|nr:unspecified product [Leishmania tarentolae]